MVARWWVLLSSVYKESSHLVSSVLKQSSFLPIHNTSLRYEEHGLYLSNCNLQRLRDGSTFLFQLWTFGAHTSWQLSEHGYLQIMLGWLRYRHRLLLCDSRYRCNSRYVDLCGLSRWLTHNPIEYWLSVDNTTLAPGESYLSECCCLFCQYTEQSYASALCRTPHFISMIVCSSQMLFLWLPE
jgi:hypothetical protein